MSQHVRPLNDERPHLLRTDCWCGPTVEWSDPLNGKPYAAGPLVIHHAADCREVSESVTGEAVTARQTWECVSA